MKKLLLVLTSASSLLSFGSEYNREYMKNTCNRTYGGVYLSSDIEQENLQECALSRFELYDKDTRKHVAHIAYNPSWCYISYLSVDEEYRKEGIGRELANQAIEDMRLHHGCGEISLISSPSAEKFWERLGAEPVPFTFKHVFPAPSSQSS